MIEIKPLETVDSADLGRLISGYKSEAKYKITKQESKEHFKLVLERKQLETPFIKSFDHLDAETIARYQKLAAQGICFGAFENDQCVAIALSEPYAWNRSLMVWEFHVAITHDRQGIGRRLMGALEEEAQGAKLRTIVCETQNTNAPAIDFYRALGFRIEGIDLSYYSNNDYPDGEVALFMKKYIP